VVCPRFRLMPRRLLKNAFSNAPDPRIFNTPKAVRKSYDVVTFGDGAPRATGVGPP
jgi:hypothetical protein